MLISLNSDDGGQTAEDGQTGLLPSVRCHPPSVLCPPSPVFVSITTLAQQTRARRGNDKRRTTWIDAASSSVPPLPQRRSPRDPRRGRMPIPHAPSPSSIHFRPAAPPTW